MSQPNPNQIVIKLVPKAMPPEYDVLKDILLKQEKWEQEMAIKKGIEIKEAKEKKARKKQDDVIISLLKREIMSTKEIASITKLSMAYVRKLSKSLEK
jgi:hypothetical protein